MKGTHYISAMILIALFMPIAKADEDKGFDSFYLGTSLGSLLVPVKTLGDRHLHLQLPGLADFPISDKWEVKRKASMNTSFHAGRGLTFGRYHAGLELSLNRARQRIIMAHESQKNMNIGGAITNIKSSSNLDIKTQDWDVSIVIRQGFMVGPKMMIYGKAGLSRNKIKYRLNSSAIIETPIGNFPIKHPISVNKNVYPVILGFGVEHKFHERLSIRADYTYIRYGNVKIKGENKVALPGGMGEFSSKHDHKLKLQNAVMMIGINYHFPC